MHKIDQQILKVNYIIQTLKRLCTQAIVIKQNQSIAFHNWTKTQTHNDIIYLCFLENTTLSNVIYASNK